MEKYSTEFKMKVVQEIVKRWVNAYKSQGYEGLKVKRENTQYTLEFKLNVVNLC